MSATNVGRVESPQPSCKWNPISIPVIEIGTAAEHNDGKVVKSAVIEAIKVGYRHFNTAAQ